ncbi:MAG: hypothetical protein LWX02_01590 [Deltaproteobacteria bacterium]|nr:hypothetical protein [Deltaproteobacteria bacterium]MDL1988484.1 hypothetical protein [Deltaproteobacteria bacterium]
MKTNTRNWQNTVAIVGIILVLGIVPYRATASDPDGVNASDPAVFAQNEAVVGMTYGDWSAAWWQYILSIPDSDNPLYDDGSDTNVCSVGQSSGPVFFLAGSWVGKVTRRCTVSSVPLFFPIINAECSDIEDPPFHGSNAHERRICAAELMDGVDVGSLEVTVDGRKVHDLEYVRVQSPDFQLTLPKDNILGLKVTSGNAVSDGYYVMLRPLTAGDHVIHFKGACVSGVCEGFSQDITYELTVTP